MQGSEASKSLIRQGRSGYEVLGTGGEDEHSNSESCRQALVAGGTLGEDHQSSARQVQR